MSFDRPLNPSGRKKARNMMGSLVIANGAVGPSLDIRGAEGAQVSLALSADETGAVSAMSIEGRHKTSDSWSKIADLTAPTAGGAAETWPADADAPGVTLPRYVRLKYTIATADLVAPAFYFVHYLPKEGRQVNHGDRS